MAGGRKKKNQDQGRNSGFLDGVMILDLEDFDDEGQFIKSMPEAQRSAGNESNQQAVSGGGQSNEAALRQEKQQKEKMPKGGVKDQNGPAPQNKEPQGGEDISPEELANVSYELDQDAMGMPIISNEIPRNVVAKVMARRAQNNPNNINNDNIIRNAGQPGNANAPGQAQAPRQAPARVPRQVAAQAPPQQAPPQQAPPQQVPQVSGPNLYSTEDLVAEAPKRKKKKAAANNAEAAQQNIRNEEPGLNIEGIGQIQYNTFKPYQKPRTDWSGTAQANYALWRGVGNTIGKASVLPASAVGKVLGITGSIKHIAHVQAQLGQKNRTHRAIPGREGQSFNPDKNTGADILADFRRVPTVWSYLTAGKAVDDNDNELDPKVSVYIEQPKTGSSRSMRFADCGHVMLGIEYTRKSKITDHKERYNIKYGFYPANGFTGPSGTMMMMQGAEVPGQLVDDATHTYDISKTYPATTPQIERIAKASEAYTERGGYAMYRRNCTTFVRDMFRAGGIATDMIDRIFTEELIRFNSAGNLGHVIGTSWNVFLDTDLQRQMGNMAHQNDTSYQGQGNKRVTKEEFDRYRETKNSAKVGQKGYAPAATGENLRRSTDAEGTFGSYNYVPAAMKRDENTTAKNAGAESLAQLQEIIAGEGRALYDAVCRIMTPEQQRAAGADFLAWMMNLENNSTGSAITTLDRARAERLAKVKEGEEEPDLYQLVTTKEVKTAYAGITDEMAEISKQYQKILGSDSRVNTEVMNLLSTMQIALRLLNNIYNDQDKSIPVGDLGMLREDMSGLMYEVKLDDNRKVNMTPTHYESYLQIFKTPEAAVMAYKKFLAVRTERTNDNQNMSSVRFKLKWSGKKQKEWERLAEIEDLANQYDQSHRDMLEKDGFTQNDIDYVFQLRKMERAGTTKATGDMYTNNASASMSYMAIFFEKIFGGMRNTAKRSQASGGIPSGADANISAMWLNDYLTRKTQAKMKGMTAILRGIMHAYDHPTRELIKGSFRTFFLNSYLRRVFPTTRTYGLKIESFGMALDPIWDNVIGNPRLSFTNTIDGIINFLMLEHSNAKDKEEQEKLKKELEQQKKKKKKK